MKKILFVNACVNRDISRTDRLARAVLDHISADDDLVSELVLEELGLQPLDSERLNRRSAAIERGDFSDALFDQAKQLKEADWCSSRRRTGTSRFPPSSRSTSSCSAPRA